jgi:hypothetical protein
MNGPLRSRSVQKQNPSQVTADGFFVADGSDTLNQRDVFGNGHFFGATLHIKVPCKVASLKPATQGVT